MVSGIGHDALPQPQRGMVMGLHFASGLSILLLSVLRLLWRIGHRPPPLPAGMPHWQVGLSRTVHWLFYALMIALPLSGWTMLSDGPRPISWLGLFTVPKLPVNKGDAIVDFAHEGHEIGGFIMGALVLLHIGAALWHQFGIRDNLIARMR